jgi:hypothetical protein
MVHSFEVASQQFLGLWREREFAPQLAAVARLGDRFPSRRSTRTPSHNASALGSVLRSNSESCCFASSDAASVIDAGQLQQGLRVARRDAQTVLTKFSAAAKSPSLA